MKNRKNRDCPKIYGTLVRRIGTVPNFSRSNLKILILSQDEFLREFFRSFLIGEGYNISVSKVETDTLDAIQREKFDLILLEDGLPRINGKTFVGKIKEIKDIPVILIAAGGIDQRTIMSLQEGADDYIEAPCEIGEIRNKIQKNLRREYV